MGGCGSNFAKVLLIIFNIVFWLSGAALLGVGIWLLVDQNVSQPLNVFAALEGSQQLLKYASYVLIAVGGFVLIVGFFGCCGAIKENRCMLGVYIVLLVLIMGLEIAAGVLAIIYRDSIQKEIEKKLGDGFKDYYNKTSDTGLAFTSGLNFVQMEFACCGINGPTDYASQPYPVQCCKLHPEAANKDPADLTEKDVADLKGCRSDVPGTLHSDTYPPSCCKLDDKSKVKVEDIKESDAVNYTLCVADLKNKDSSYGYPDGCFMALDNWIKTHAIILIGVGIGVACLELFGFIFAVCLCRSIGDDE